MPRDEAPQHIQIFLSTVTAEFGSYRDRLADDLDLPHVSVKRQERFVATGKGTLEKLNTYVRDCDAMIHVVGDMTGATPHYTELAELPEDVLYRLPAVRDALASGVVISYTQWEAYLAIYHDRRLFICVPDPATERDKTFIHDPARAAAQSAHLERLNTLGKYDRIQFANPDRLAFKVLASLSSVFRDSVPAPVPPPISLPYPSIDTLFKGREAFLQRLRESLRTTGNGRVTAIAGKALHGLGGVGKTRLAVEYAWQHQEDYTAVLFVTADSPEALRANLAKLTGPLVLNLTEHDAPEEDVRLAAALRWLREHPGWFLILDNVDTPEAVKAVKTLVAQLSGGQVLITGRLSQRGAWVESMDLGVLATGPAAEFLLQRTPQRRKRPTDNEDAAALATELGGLALALEQAGAYITTQRVSLADYLRSWRSHEKAVQEWYDPAVMDYPCTVAVTWQTTMNRLGPEEASLLNLLAWFGPKPIPLVALENEDFSKEWRAGAELICPKLSCLPRLMRWFSRPRGPSPVSGSLPVATTIADAIATLARFNMVQRDPTANCVSVHRVVQDIVRTRIPQNQRVAWLGLALGSIMAAIPPVSERGYSDAERQMRSNLANAEQRFGPDDPVVATLLDDLVMLLLITKRLADAEPLMRRVVEIFVRFGVSTGHEHPHLRNSQRNYQGLLRAMGRSDAEIQAALRDLEAEAGLG